MLPARRPYVDELASSAIERCCRQFNVSIGKLGSIHIGRDGWHPTFLGASPLHALAELLATSPEDLVWDHTVFPYATAMMQARYWENVLLNAWGEDGGVVGLGGVVQNVTLGLHHRRYCRSCAAEEFARLRESYWHRSHNLPGVHICLNHGTFLHESMISARSKATARSRLPHEAVGRRLGRGIPPPHLVQVAKISVGWLSRPREPGVPMEPTQYRQLAITSGWLAQDRDANNKLLIRAVLTRFSRRYLAQAGAPIADRPNFWAAMMLRPRTTMPFTPIKHAILQCLLAEGPPDGIQINHVPGGPSGASAVSVDARLSRSAAAELKRVLNLGLVLTTEQFLSRIGAWSLYRHRMAELPRLRAVVREFRGSAATVKRLRPGKTLYSYERASIPPA